MIQQLNWFDDALFQDGPGGVGYTASPAFRLSVYLPYERGYHGFHCAACEELFEAYKDIIRAECDRVLVNTVPGGASIIAVSESNPKTGHRLPACSRPMTPWKTAFS